MCHYVIIRLSSAITSMVRLARIRVTQDDILYYYTIDQ